MKTIGAALIVGLLLLVSTPSQAEGDDAKTCVGAPVIDRNPNCKKGNSARIQNRCDVPVEARICIYTTEGKWDCGVSYAIEPGKSWSYPSCFGTNKTFYDARPSGSKRRFDNPLD